MPKTSTIKNPKTLGVVLESSVHKKLGATAKRETKLVGRSVSTGELIRRAVDAFLAGYEAPEKVEQEEPKAKPKRRKAAAKKPAAKKTAAKRTTKANAKAVRGKKRGAVAKRKPSSGKK